MCNLASGVLFQRSRVGGGGHLPPVAITTSLLYDAYVHVPIYRGQASSITAGRSFGRRRRRRADGRVISHLLRFILPRFFLRLHSAPRLSCGLLVFLRHPPRARASLFYGPIKVIDLLTTDFTRARSCFTCPCGVLRMWSVGGKELTRNTRCSCFSFVLFF